MVTLPASTDSRNDGGARVRVAPTRISPGGATLTDELPAGHGRTAARRRSLPRCQTVPTSANPASRKAFAWAERWTDSA